jgi:hypothetical protein
MRSSIRLPAVFVLLTAAASSPLAAQSFNLRDMLTDFLRNGITLAPPPEGFPSHEAHFIGDDSPQFRAVEQLNSLIASQLSSFPLASSSGGFVYQFDPALGVLTRATESFGPIYAERADTIGKGRFNLGINYSHFTFDQINDLSLREGDLRLVFTHEDVNHDHTNTNLFFEGDVITAALRLNIKTDIAAFVFDYGLLDNLDVGFAVPIVSVDMEAQTSASIDRLATGTTAPGIHRFQNGQSTETFSESGSASGLGDIVLRTKWRFLSSPKAGMALALDARLPTGDELDLLGTGATQLKAFVVGSGHFDWFNPHLNAGYTWSLEGSDDISIADEINYTAGFDISVGPRFTFVFDAIGRTFLNTRNIRVENTLFEANTTPNPADPPNIVSAVLPRMVTESGDINQILGSVGVKINPFGNFLLTLNGLFPLNSEGLQDGFTPLVGIDYSF